MARIALENMRFRAHHGLHEEERLIGTNFTLDVHIDAQTYAAAVIKEHDTEKVVNTVDYALVYDICCIEMGKPQLLLETVIKRITYRLKEHFPNMHAIEIKLSKLNPPLGGIVGSASITDADSFDSTCGKCKSPIICYLDDTCWCKQDGVKDRIHPRTAELINQQYGGCLCARCLKSMEG